MQLVLVHGAGGSGQVWRSQAAYLPDCDAVTLPGHPRGTSYNRVEDYVNWLRGYIAGRGYGRVVLGGHSMGGAITLTYALKYPDELAGIALVATGARLRVLPRIFEMIREDYRSYAKWVTTLSLAPDAAPDVRQAAIDRVLAVDPDVIYGDFEACDRFDVMAEIDRVSLPALIIAGSEDKMTPVKYGQYLCDRIPNSKIVLVDGAGHYVQLERPAETNAALEQFVQQLGKQEDKG